MTEKQDRIRRLAAVLAAGEEPAVAGKILLHGDDFAKREEYPKLSAADVAKLYYPQDPDKRKALEEQARQDLASGALSPFFTAGMTTFEALAHWENRPAMQEGHPLADFLPFAAHASPSKGTQRAPAGKKWEVAGAWEHEARAIGEAWMLAEEQRTGERPGVEAIARYVEGELSNRGTTGKRGKFPDWETIKREALTGITGRKAKGRK